MTPKDAFHNIKLAWLLAIFLASTFIFLHYPTLDLAISALFYNQGFIYANNLLLLCLHKSVYVISGIILVFLPIAFIYEAVTNKKLFKVFGKKEIIYLALCLAIGPGLIVNHTFKNNYFGRARPSHIKEFGGNKEFSPLFKVSNNCATNCSFSSGHAALAFYLTAFALLFKKRQGLIFMLAIAFGNLVGLARIVQGGHFLSDIVFSAIIVMGVNIVLYNGMFRGR